MKFDGSWKAYVFWTVLILACFISLNVALRRVMFERANRGVTLAVSNREVDRLAIFGGIPRSDLLAKLKEEVGISAVAVEEDTIEDYIEAGRLTLLKGSEIINLYRIGHVNQFVLTNLYQVIEVKPQYFYLIIERQEDYEHIKDMLFAKFGRDNVTRVGELNILEVLDEKDHLLSIGLGISPDTIADLQGYGLTIIPRFQNSHRLNRQVINLKFKTIQSLRNELLIFEGKTVLGYPNSLDIVAGKMSDRRLHLGLVEFNEQAGVEKLARRNPLSVVWVHSIPEDAMENLSVDEAVQRYVRAGKERGVKVLFLHPFFNIGLGESVLDVNMLYFNKIKTELHRAHISVSPKIAKYDRHYQGARSWEILIISMAILMMLMKLSKFYIRLKPHHTVLAGVAAAFLFAALFVTGHLWLWITLSAITAAIVFPTFAMVSQFRVMDEGEKRLKETALYVLRVCGITLIGALFIVGILSSPQYLVGIIRFSGVKLSFMTSLLLIWVYFFLYPHRINSLYYMVRRVTSVPVRMVSLLAGLACLMFVLVYLIRSGNAVPIHIPMMESGMRSFLESNFLIRPRTKEFLVGYPLLILTFFYAGRGISRQWIWFFNGLGSVALISLINTFCHFHTPLIISLVRFVYGLVLGSFMAALYAGIAILVIRLAKRALRS